MAQDTDVIRSQIERTRASLTEKIGTLEEEVHQKILDATTAVTDTVSTVKETVEDTLASVKDTVHGTVESVKETFNLRRQVEQHPCIAFFSSVGAGYLLGTLFPVERAAPSAISLPNESAEGRDGQLTNGKQFIPPEELMPQRSSLPTTVSKPGLLSTLRDKFGPEIEKLEAIALGTLTGLVRQFVTEMAPPGIAGKLSEVINSASEKFGGEPLSLRPRGEGSRMQEPEHNGRTTAAAQEF